MRSASGAERWNFMPSDVGHDLAVDVAVLGAGPAGIGAAIAAHAAGRSVLLIRTGAPAMPCGAS